MRIILMGAPGAGKGTYAQYFRERYCIPHISTGDVFREEIARNTELGSRVRAYIERGELVPDEIVVEVVRSKLSQLDLSRGFVLDGYPRTVVQARALDQIMPIDVAIHLIVSEEVAVRRLSGRRVCPVCNRIYNVYYEPKPREDELCDYDGAKLVRRRDDEPRVVENRYRVFYQTIGPVVEYYRETNRLVEVDANRPAREVAPELERALIDRGVIRLEPCRANFKLA